MVNSTRYTPREFRDAFPDLATRYPEITQILVANQFAFEEVFPNVEYPVWITLENNLPLVCMDKYLMDMVAAKAGKEQPVPATPRHLPTLSRSQVRRQLRATHYEALAASLRQEVLNELAASDDVAFNALCDCANSLADDYSTGADAEQLKLDYLDPATWEILSNPNAYLPLLEFIDARSSSDDLADADFQTEVAAAKKENV